MMKIHNTANQVMRPTGNALTITEESRLEGLLHLSPVLKCQGTCKCGNHLRNGLTFNSIYICHREIINYRLPSEKYKDHAISLVITMS
jgi:hypothetical protein